MLLHRSYDARGQHHRRGAGERGTGLLESRVHQVENGGNDGSNRHRVRTYSGDSPGSVLWFQKTPETFCFTVQ